MKTKDSNSSSLLQPHILKQYVQLAKPGIIRGNVMTAAAGFFLAAGLASDYDWLALLFVLIGTSLIVACGCMINNVIDRDIDKEMKRTKSRATVTGAIPISHALVTSAVLGITGFIILTLGVNLLTAYIGLFGLIFYALVYTIAKRYTHHSTLIGALPGAVPPVAGYVAVTGSLDTTATTLFLVMLFWQMPHFYAIALYRSSEYQKTGLPLLPFVKGIARTKLEIMLYITAFGIAAVSLAVYAELGYLYLAVIALTSLYWFYVASKGYNSTDTDTWGKKVFFTSLLIILIWSLTISVSPLNT